MNNNPDYEKITNEDVELQFSRWIYSINITDYKTDQLPRIQK